MDSIDIKILNLIQERFPLSVRPFKIIAEDFGLTEEEVIKRIKYLKETKIIRQLSPIFDTKALGYNSSLVAAKVEDNFMNAIEILNQHPGITHNYERTHSYNIWFTIATPPGSDLSIHLSTLKKLTKIDSLLLLPAIKVFKIKVVLNLENQLELSNDTDYNASPKNNNLTEKDKMYIKFLQEDLDLVEFPFQSLAEKLNTSQNQIVNILKDFQNRGLMRRFAAILNHKNAGFKYNAMSVWEVEDACIDRFAKKILKYQNLTHCYIRPTYPDWPYSLFAMVHGKTKQDCEKIIDEIVKSNSNYIKSYDLLYSTREFKKVRLKYFDGSIESWEKKFVK